MPTPLSEAPNLLRLLASFIDAHPQVFANIGAEEDTEVQDDLRFWADEIAVVLARTGRLLPLTINEED